MRTIAAGAYALRYTGRDARPFDRRPLAAAVRERSGGLVGADGRPQWLARTPT